MNDRRQIRVWVWLWAYDRRWMGVCVCECLCVGGVLVYLCMHSNEPTTTTRIYSLCSSGASGWSTGRGNLPSLSLYLSLSVPPLALGSQPFTRGRNLQSNEVWFVASSLGGWGWGTLTTKHFAGTKSPSESSQTCSRNSLHCCF